MTWHVFIQSKKKLAIFIGCSIGSVEDSFRFHEILQYDVRQAYSQSSLDLRLEKTFWKIPQIWTMIQ